MSMERMRKMFHWGPITAFAIIKLVTLMTIRSCNLWLPPTMSVLGFFNKGTFLVISGLTLYNMVTAILEGPGYLPLKWVPEDARCEAYLQFCSICEGFKAPRAHHCRKCGRCVMKMDHHCPWINNCVGHFNHLHFTSFLFFAVLGCSHATIILFGTLYTGFYKAINPTEQLQEFFTIYSLVLTVFALGLSIGVVLAVGMLLYFQVRAIVRNRTSIEDWIVEKAIHRRGPEDPPFIYPYNTGWLNNVTMVISVSGGFKIWDGTYWPVRDDCHQFTLTLEQKEQKNEKRQRTRAYSAVRHYSGYWVPVVHGCCTSMYIPCTDEARIPLQPGDSVLVTRWRKYWLFGERKSCTDGSTARGWFPRCCVVEVSALPDENNCQEEVTSHTDGHNPEEEVTPDTKKTQ